MAIARDGAVDQARVLRPQGLVADAQPVHDSGPKALHNDVRIAGERLEDLQPIRMLQIEPQRPLIPLKREVRRRSPFGFAGRLSHIFDDEHIRPQIAQQHGAVGTRGELREIEHTYA